jgi:hypothetical protein
MDGERYLSVIFSAEKIMELPLLHGTSSFSEGRRRLLMMFEAVDKSTQLARTQVPLEKVTHSYVDIYVRNHKSHINVDSRHFAASSATKIIHREALLVIVDKIAAATPYVSITTAVPKYYAPKKAVHCCHHRCCQSLHQKYRRRFEFSFNNFFRFLKNIIS